MSMHLIGISGFKRSGKDTAADFIQLMAENHRIPSNRFAIADTVIEKASAVFGFKRDDWDKLKVNGVMSIGDGSIYRDVRDVVRDFGMALIDADETYLIRNAEAKLQPFMLNIVTDVRFDREIDMIKRNGGLLIKIVRPGVGSDGHVTEQHLDDDKYDAIVVNDGDLDQLELRIANVCRCHYKTMFKDNK